MYKNQYKTTSLSLAAAIQTVSKAKLETIIFTPFNNRAEFVFDESKDPNLNMLTTQFWAKELSIDAFSYFEALRYLKSRLYEEKQNA